MQEKRVGLSNPLEIFISSYVTNYSHVKNYVHRENISNWNVFNSNEHIFIENNHVDIVLIFP